ncbi:MAG TPA: SPOR domain-containing protein, partial [Ramlibacter sp.]|nr:SPOR domain-containing protein [Ramlibacter sp.]
MLRLVVLLLLLANGAFFAWSQGLLLAWGLGPAQQAEPQRLQQQVRPDSIRVLKSDELRQLEAIAAQSPRPPECLQTAALDESQIAQVRSALGSWPAGSWTLESVT